MTDLYPGAAALLAIAALFFLFPGWFMRRSYRQNLRDSNLDWYRLRERELASAGDSEELLEETRLRLLEDEVDQIEDAQASVGANRNWVWFVLALIASVLLYLELGSAEDVSLTRDLEVLAREGTDESYNALMQRIEKRAAQRPDNLHYQAMLGRYYMNRADYGAASRVYEGLVERAPGDDTALAMAAQARYLAGGRKLDSQSQMLAEKALAVNPHQATALGLLGMSAYEAGHYRAAIGYWRRLVAMQDPSSESAQMIRGVIARAEQALGDQPAGEAEASASIPQPAASSGLGVTVSLQVPDGARVSPTDSVFVFARNPESSSRMPVAVKRLTVADLPVTLRLDDAASMAGQKISELSQVLVVARISPNGQPGEQHASYQGSLGPLPPEVAGEVRQIELQAKKI